MKNHSTKAMPATNQHRKRRTTTSRSSDIAIDSVKPERIREKTERIHWIDAGVPERWRVENSRVNERERGWEYRTLSQETNKGLNWDTIGQMCPQNYELKQKSYSVMNDATERQSTFQSSGFAFGISTEQNVNAFEHTSETNLSKLWTVDSLTQTAGAIMGHKHLHQWRWSLNNLLFRKTFFPVFRFLQIHGRMARRTNNSEVSSNSNLSRSEMINFIRDLWHPVPLYSDQFVCGHYPNALFL